MSNRPKWAKSVVEKNPAEKRHFQIVRTIRNNRFTIYKHVGSKPMRKLLITMRAICC